MRHTNKNIKKAIELSRQLLFCADKGDLQRDDASCGVLYGIIRDSAYKIIAAAECERSKHIDSGKWDETDDEEQESCSSEQNK